MIYKIGNKDLNLIVSNAKQNMVSLNLPLCVSRVELEPGVVPSLAILESVLMFLNSRQLLVKLVEVDYTKEYDDNDSDELTEKEPVK